MNRYQKMSRRPNDQPRRKAFFPKLQERIGIGLLAGLLMAGLLSAYLLVAAAIRGSTYYARYDITTWQAIGAYLLAAVIAGAVFGLLQPLAQTRTGATVVGMVVGSFAYGALMVATLGWSKFEGWGAVVLGVPVGGLGGFVVGKPEKA